MSMSMPKEAVKQFTKGFAISSPGLPNEDLSADMPLLW
jgi:hypothetical protein